MFFSFCRETAASSNLRSSETRLTALSQTFKRLKLVTDAAPVVIVYRKTAGQDRADGMEERTEMRLEVRAGQTLRRLHTLTCAAVPEVWTLFPAAQQPVGAGPHSTCGGQKRMFIKLVKQTSAI